MVTSLTERETSCYACCGCSSNKCEAVRLDPIIGPFRFLSPRSWLHSRLISRDGLRREFDQLASMEDFIRIANLRIHSPNFSHRGPIRPAIFLQRELE